MCITNPWLSISLDNLTKIAPCDQSEIEKLSPSDKEKIFLDLTPEPFIGDPQANVYLLNGNPGYSDTDNCFSCSALMTSIMKDVYSHKNISFIWNDFNHPLEIECPRTGRKIKHPGQEYWEKRLKDLTKALGRNPRLFELEFFPYHTKDFYKFMERPFLPSFEYTRYLVEKALEEDKTIFILRHKVEWEKSIKGLKDYPKKYTLKSPRRTYLTEGNMKDFAWSALIQNC